MITADSLINPFFTHPFSIADFIILLNLNLLNDSTLSLFLTALRAYVSINWIARCYFIKSESEDERTN